MAVVEKIKTKIDLTNLKNNSEEINKGLKNSLRKRAIRVEREVSLSLNNKKATYLGFCPNDNGFPVATFKLSGKENYLQLYASSFQPYSVFTEAPKENATEAEKEALISPTKKPSKQGVKSREEMREQILSDNSLSISEKSDKCLLLDELALAETLKEGKQYIIHTELEELSVGKWEGKLYPRKRVDFYFK